MSCAASIRRSHMVFCAALAFLRLAMPSQSEAFDFNDGTNQGWVRAGFYDDGELTPISGAFIEEPAPWTDDYDWPNVPPDDDAPAGHGAIFLGGDGFAPSSPSDDLFVHWDLNSPDLSTDPIWGKPTSFRFGLLGDIFSDSGAFNFVQVVWHVMKPDGEESYFRWFDRQNNAPIFHQVTHNATAWETIDVVHTLPEGSAVLDINFRVFFEADNPYTGFIAIDELEPIEIVSEWSSPDSGGWSDAANWSTGHVPDGFDQTAVFGEAIVSPATVTVDTDVSVGQLIFSNSTDSYTIADDLVHRLTLAGEATVDVVSGSHTIAANLLGGKGLRKLGPGELRLSGEKTYAGATVISEGVLSIDSPQSVSAELHVDAGATFDVTSLEVYELQPNQLVCSGIDCAVLNGQGVVLANTLAIPVRGAMRGSLTVNGNVSNAGRVAPGFSPEVIVINGDYTQSSTGILEIEVGGLSPGTEHDQLVVTDTATLGGRLEVPIIDDFVPAQDDEVQFLTASSVTGSFSSVFSPNLAAIEPDLALQIVYGEQDATIRFVATSSSIAFDSQGNSSEWFSPETWSMGNVPDSTNIIAVNNLIGVAQRVEVESQNAFVHQLTIGDDANPITLGVQSGNSLSATAGVAVGNQGIVELMNGTLVSSAVRIEEGGRLTGSGTIVGNVTNSGDLSPGLSPGALTIDGNFVQQSGGILRIEIEGTDSSQFDRLEIMGAASLHGALVVDTTNYPELAAGDSFAFLTAESFASSSSGGVSESLAALSASIICEGDLFDQTTFLGSDNFFTAIECDGRNLFLRAYERGDMNLDTSVDSGDVELLVLALFDKQAYETHVMNIKEGFVITHVEATVAGNVDRKLGFDFDDLIQFSAMANVSSADLLAIVGRYRPSIPEPSGNLLLMFGAVLVTLLNSHGRCTFTIANRVDAGH